MDMAKRPEAGDPAPAFVLPDDAGHMHRLSDHFGWRVVLFVFPRADTPGCTAEAVDFSALAADFDAAGARVIGLSADPPAKLARFRAKHQIGVTLLSDEAKDVLRAYGAWGEKSMYGKVFEGALRSTYLIGADGRIQHVWRNVKVRDHARQVLTQVIRHL